MTLCSPPPTVKCLGCGNQVPVIHKPPGAVVAAPMPPAGEYPVRCERCRLSMVVTVKVTLRKDGSVAYGELKARPVARWQAGHRR